MTEELRDEVSVDPREDAALAGIAPCFHPVVKRYGRKAFMVVWQAQMAGEAARRLAAQGERRQSREILHATAVISSAFNELAGLIAEAEGWTPEFLAQVDRDAQLAWASSIQTTRADSVIVMQ